MPRWPVGWHLASGSLPALGQRNRRIPVTSQEQYWHMVTAELHAATPTVTVDSTGKAAAMTGPAGVGERWHVQLVQVNTSTERMRNVTAQVWLAVGGITFRLLAQTSYGGYDDIGVGGRPVAPGEQIAVQWTGATPGDSAYAVVTGVKYVLAGPEIAQ